MLNSFTAARLRPLRLASCAALAASLSATTLASASAETRVRVRYEVTLAGFNVGTATMQTGIDKASYDMNLSVRMSGLMKFLTGGKGAATSRGAYDDTHVNPSAYALNTRSSDKGQIVRFALAGGSVRQLSVEPPPKVSSETIPITDADKRNITDPLSAVMMPVAGTGDLLAQSSCDRTLPIFDGRARFDVKLRYDRMESVKVDKDTPPAPGSYTGKLIVCKASYKPISGHKPNKSSVKYMQDNKDMEVWLAPIAGTRALMPWKIAVKTQLGTAVVTATSFVVDPSGKPGNGTDL